MRVRVRVLVTLLVLLFAASILPAGAPGVQMGKLPLLRGIAFAQGYQSYPVEAYKPYPEEEFEEQIVSDPLEPLNRAIFKFNDKVYFWALKPVSTAWATVIPEGLRIAIRNGFYNILAPARIVNNLLQRKFKGSGIEASRFLINSTLGLGGLIDFAKRQWNLESHDEDFGQTLGFYGAKPGFYIVWPFIGPSSLRDSIGLAGSIVLDPLFYIDPNIFVYLGLKAGQQLNDVSLRLGEYEDFLRSALDPYVAMRNGYIQYRRNLIGK